MDLKTNQENELSKYMEDIAALREKLDLDK